MELCACMCMCVMSFILLHCSGCNISLPVGSCTSAACVHDRNDITTIECSLTGPVGRVAYAMQLIGLSSFRTATVLLIGLLAYDVFWVFGSPKVIGDNVMLTVATSNVLTGPVRLLFPRPLGHGEAKGFPFALLGESARLLPSPSRSLAGALPLIPMSFLVLVLPDCHPHIQACMAEQGKASVCWPEGQRRKGFQGSVRVVCVLYAFCREAWSSGRRPLMSAVSSYPCGQKNTGQT